MLRWLLGRVRLHPLSRDLASVVFSTPLLVNSRPYLALERAVIRVRARRFERRPPQILHVENTNHCNAKCIMCPNPTMDRIKSFMDDRTYTRVASEAARFGIPTISIVSIGEPSLDKKIVGRIAEAKRLGLRVTTATNGSLLSPERGNGFIDAGLDELHISLDGATKETFEAIRIGLNFEKVVGNIDGFLALRRKRRKKHPKVILRYVGLVQNQHETQAFLRRWRGKADDVIISHAHDWAGGVSESFRGKFHARHLRRAPCRLPWEELMVHHDGSVVACCHDHEGTMVMGNLLTESLQNIWNGEPLRRLRQAHMSGDLGKYRTCTACQINTIWLG